MFQHISSTILHSLVTFYSSLFNFEENPVLLHIDPASKIANHVAVAQCKKHEDKGDQELQVISVPLTVACFFVLTGFE